MAITVEARTEIISLVVGMFGAAPGASVLSDLVAAYEAGSTTAQIAANLAGTAEFKSIYPTFLTNGEYATKIVDNLLAEATAAAKAEAVTVLTAELNGGMSRTAAFIAAINFVASTATTNTAYGTSAAAFDNKVEVATYYSVDKQLSGSSLEDLQDVISGVTSAAATVTSAKAAADGEASTGNQFSLTADQDTLTGTGGDDVFTANVLNVNGTLKESLQSVDQISGGNGNDTINITLNTAATTTTPTLNSIENVNLRSTVANGILSLAAATGVEKVSVANSTLLAQVQGVGAASTLSVANQTTNVEFDGSTATTLALNLDAAGSSGTQLVVDLGKTAASKATTLNITTSGSNVEVLDTTGANVATTATIAATGSNTLKLTDGLALSSLTVTGSGSVNTSSVGLVKVGTLTVGDGGITFSNGVSTATTFTATTGAGKDTLTVTGGNVKSIATGAGDDKVTTANSALLATSTVDLGAGNDTLTLGAAPTAGATLTGGDGTDIIAMAIADYTTVSGFTSTNLAKITGFETLSITGAALANATTVDLSKITGLTSAQILGVANTGAASITNVGAGSSVVIKGNMVAGQADGSLTVSLKDATGTSDAIDITVDQAITQNNDGTVDTFTSAITGITLTGIETVNVKSTGTLSTAVTTGNATDKAVNGLVITNNDLVTLNISGDQAFTFTSAAGMTKLATVNLSASTAGGTVNLNAGTIAATVTGSAKADTITGTAKADTISGGEGADFITGGNGADSISGGAGNDTFIYSNVTHSTLVNLDVISDFSANTYGNGTNGAAGTGANATASLRNGDVIRIDVTTIGLNVAPALADGVVVSVQSNAADAQTFLQNLGVDATAALDNAVGVALDSSTGRLYIDVDSNGTVDSVIQLTGVTTITAAAFELV